MLTKQIEADAWKHISKVVLDLLSMYPTSIEEDEEFLRNDEDDPENSTLTLNIKNCIKYRKNEKKLLHYLMDSCERI